MRKEWEPWATNMPARLAEFPKIAYQSLATFDSILTHKRAFMDLSRVSILLDLS